MIFVLWIVQFALPLAPGMLSVNIHVWTTVAYFVWAGVEILRLIFGQRKALAIHNFRAVWKEHLRG